MKTLFICRKPITHELHGVCDRYPDNVCCMCGGVSVSIEINDIKNMIHLLDLSGINSKHKVSNILKEIINNKED